MFHIFLYMFQWKNIMKLRHTHALNKFQWKQIKPLWSSYRTLTVIFRFARLRFRPIQTDKGSSWQRVRRISTFALFYHIRLITRETTGLKNGTIISKLKCNPHLWHNGPLTRYAKLWVAHARECRERFPRRASDPDIHHGTCVTHLPWCMPGSLTSGFLWRRWRGKRSRHSRRMRNPQFCVSGKRPIMRNLSHPMKKYANYTVFAIGKLW